MKNTFFYLVIFISISVIQPVTKTYAEQNKLTKSDQVEYEIGLYHFFNSDFIKSSFQFKKVLNEYPQFEKMGDVIKFYLLSLAELQQHAELKKNINTYKELIEPNTIFSVVENFHRWGNDKAALDVLKAIYVDKLSSAERDNYNYLMALTYIYLNDSNLQSKMTTRKQGRGDETVQLVRRGADDEDDEGVAVNANWSEKPDLWISHIKEISTENDYYFKGNILYGKLLFRDRNFDLAILTLQDLLTKNPPEHIENQIRVLLGKIYFEKKEYAKSAEYFNSLTTVELPYEALEGLYWSYFKNEEFLMAGETLKILESRFKRKFDENFLLINISYSYFLAGEYITAKYYFDQLIAEIDSRKKIMNSLMQDENMSKKISFMILRDFFNSTPKDDLQLKSLGMVDYKKIRDNFDFLILADIYSSTDKLSNDALRIINQANSSYSSFQNKYGVIKQFYDDFKNKNKTLDDRYNSLKERVDKLEFSVGGTKHNENYFKEWLESNISDYSDKLNRDMTDFEKKIVQMFTHEIIYQQKIDKKFIDKIVINKKSLENIHTASLTKWTERADDILTAYEKNSEDLEKIKKIKDDIKVYMTQISELQGRILRYLFKKVKKEAFRVLYDIETIEKDVLNDYLIVKKNLPVETKQKVENVISQ